MTRLIISCDMAFHSATRAWESSRTFCTGFGSEESLRESMSQTCYIGFRSGDLAGQSMTSITSSSKKFRTTLAVRGRALSCTKRKVSPIAPAYSITIGSRISFRYLWSGPSDYLLESHKGLCARQWITAIPPNLSHPKTPVTGRNMVAAIVCEEHRSPVAQLPSNVFLGKL